MAKKKVKSQVDIYWENRTLCSDESCIGVIGPDGHCKECGEKFKGDLPKVSIQAEAAPPPDEPKILLNVHNQMPRTLSSFFLAGQRKTRANGNGR